MKIHSFKSRPIPLAVCHLLATGLLTAFVLPVHAAQGFKVGDFDLSINSTISVGTSMRVEGQDRSLYSSGNSNSDGIKGTGLSNTSDDGELNFAKGDQFSTVIKGVHDFDLKKDNYGFFTRVKWFYDYTLNNQEVFHGSAANNNVPNQRLNDSGYNPYARFDGINLLDAFAYINTSLADKPLDLRIGRQVISWGESTLILSPISGLNTVDVSAFQRPGADLKEGFTPSEMLYGNWGVADGTSLEAFYQLKWRKTVPEGCGTYFSTNDFIADGCKRLAFVNTVPDSTNMAAGFAAAGGPVNRSADNDPSDGGQFGLALRKYASSLDTEFGGYFLNYHSRLPVISVRASNTPTPATLPIGPGGAVIPVGAAGLTAGNALPYALGGNNGTYFVDYPENISVLGLSAATNVGAWALSGEVSQAFDVPLQLNANDLLSSALTAGAGSASPTPLDRRVRASKPGDVIRGYDRFDVTQVQSTLIRTFDRALGSSQVALVGEVGAIFVDGLPAVAPGQRYGRNPVFGTAGTDGYVTDFSWGYRIRSSATYRNVIGDIDLIPSIVWSHDVKGWSPEPGQVFNEGRKSLGLGLTFELDANTRVMANYTTFANSAKYDPLRDRDYVSLSASYSF